MVSALDSGSGPGQVNVVFLGKTRYSHSAPPPEEYKKDTGES